MAARPGYAWVVLGAAFAIITMAIGTLFTLGVFLVPTCTGMGLGSWAGGAIHDALGTYQWLFVGSFAIGAAAAVLGVALRPPARVVAPARAY